MEAPNRRATLKAWTRGQKWKVVPNILHQRLATQRGGAVSDLLRNGGPKWEGRQHQTEKQFFRGGNFIVVVFYIYNISGFGPLFMIFLEVKGQIALLHTN